MTAHVEVEGLGTGLGPEGKPHVIAGRRDAIPVDLAEIVVAENDGAIFVVIEEDSDLGRPASQCHLIRDGEPCVATADHWF